MDEKEGASSSELALWYQEVGLTALLCESPVDKVKYPVQTYTVNPQQKKPEQKPPEVSTMSSSRVPPASPPPHQGLFHSSPQSSSLTAQELAQSANSLEQLKEIMQKFEGCTLKKTAKNMVFSDGNPEADVMLIGEAPGADEDQMGLPFVGRSGKLLDKMMAAIGLDRTLFYISNIIPWRPPGNRPPTSSETATCLPFIDRHIALIKPKVIVMVGGTAAKSLLGSKDGITNLRGCFSQFQPTGFDHPIETFAIYHPAYLLRSPGQKRRAWHDLIVLKHRLKEMGIKLGL